VTVLRRGKAVHHCKVADTHPLLAAAMVGESPRALQRPFQSQISRQPSWMLRMALGKNGANGVPALQVVQQLNAMGDRGTLAVQWHQFCRGQPGEILGVAGVSGNGQRELVEALVGQRPRLAGTVSVNGEAYGARREENRRLKVRSLPEEPLRNACVGDLSVAENMALRDFDQPPLSTGTGPAAY
jgi:ABC-type uncharacterized transport system ATPase subunit